MNLYRIKPDLRADYMYVKEPGLSWQEIDLLVAGKELESVTLKDQQLGGVTGKTPDLMGSGIGDYFVSSRFKNLIEARIKSQYIKFHRVKLGGEIFYLLNLIGLRDCMDYENSTFTVFDTVKEPDEISNLVVHWNAIEEFDIFRLRDEPIRLFVTGALKEEMERAGLKGIRFSDDMNMMID